MEHLGVIYSDPRDVPRPLEARAEHEARLLRRGKRRDFRPAERGRWVALLGMGFSPDDADVLIRKTRG